MKSSELIISRGNEGKYGQSMLRDIQRMQNSLYIFLIIKWTERKTTSTCIEACHMLGESTGIR
ncbi:MAG: hypothetical protein IKS93_00245 [Methanobrevibacter sp.]|nr:hypothetical protein [Methanobrevibacter sp.]